MKLQISNFKFQAFRRPVLSARRDRRGFTLVEIAICLGIIGFALVAIIGILPRGFHTQRDSRQETVIAQDATILFEAVRNGSRGADELTNYVYLISNTVTAFNNRGQVRGEDRYVYTYTDSSINEAPNGSFPITNGLRIIGLLSTPQLQDLAGNPTNNIYSGGFSNRIVALVHGISGVAAERPPQDNEILRDDGFSYRIYVVNSPSSVINTNIFYLPVTNSARIYAENISQNLRELRMAFYWPLLPNGQNGMGRQVLRASVAGQLRRDNSGLFFYQPQIFTNAPHP